MTRVTLKSQFPAAWFTIPMMLITWASCGKSAVVAAVEEAKEEAVVAAEAAAAATAAVTVTATEKVEVKRQVAEVVWRESPAK
jgi:hypothetical protein